MKWPSRTQPVLSWKGTRRAWLLDPQVRQFGQPHPAVKEQPDDGRVSPLLEAPSLTHRQQPPQLLVAQDGDGLLGDQRRLHPGHRRLPDLALLDEVGEEAGERPVAIRRRRRPAPGQDVFDVGLDVLAPEVAGVHGHAPCGQEAQQLVGRADVGGQRLGRPVGGPQPGPGRDEAGTVAYPWAGGNVRKPLSVTR
jgi:hypothetical protein